MFCAVCYGVKKVHLYLVHAIGNSKGGGREDHVPPPAEKQPFKNNGEKLQDM